MFTKWTDYKKSLNLASSESYSQRVTGSGHITVSALIEKDGALRAFPPKAGNKAFPVFVTWDASAGGKFNETLEGTYPRKGWELSCAVEQGRARLAGIFFEKYAEVRGLQVQKARREAKRQALVEETLTGALVVEVPKKDDPAWAHAPIEEIILVRHFAGEGELSCHRQDSLSPEARLFQMNSGEEEFRFFVTRWDSPSQCVMMAEVGKEQFDRISELL